MVKVIALVVLVLLIVVSVLLGRKIKPYELEEETVPGVKPYIPSEQVAIFGTRWTRVEDILRQDNPDYLPLDDMIDPEAERALADGDSFRAKGQLQQAKDSYLRASQLLPDDITILLRLAETQENLGDVPGALATYLQVQAINPEIAEAAAALERLQ